MNTAELTFSVIFNTVDRARSVQTLLHALEHQSYPHFEVIAVVGPTYDNTLEVLEAYKGRVRVLRCAESNLSMSRNTGLLAARGDIVAYLDDDAAPSRHWLKQLAALFADPLLAATGGMVYLAHPNQPMIQHRVGIVSSLAEQMDVRGGWLDGLPSPGAGRHWIARMMGTNMAYRRRVLLEVGGFDEFLEYVYDETDLSMRLVRAGKVVHPVLEAPIYHIPGNNRNRVAFTYVGRWWIQTKAALYFLFKNRTPGDDDWRTLLRRSIFFSHGHWIWLGQLWREKKITLRQMLYMRYQEVRSTWIGIGAGLWQARKLIAPPLREAALQENRAIEPFLTPASANQPTVDVVSGARANITLSEPPLRICLLSHDYPPTQFEGVGRHTNLMARGLFALGHTVHVVTRGDREQVSFYDGAYVHRIPYALTRYGRYQRLPKAHHVLNYSHSVYEKVKRLVLNDGVQVVDSPIWQINGLVVATSGLLPVVVRAQTALRQVAMLQQDRDPDTLLVGELEQNLLTQAAYLAPNSLATVKALREVYGLTPDEARYEVVPHGIEAVADEEVRLFNLAHPPNTLTALYVGRLEKRKGVLDLFAAIPQVMERVHNVRFIFAGNDNSVADGFQGRSGLSYAAYFAKHYPAQASRVEFLGGVSEEKLQNLYQRCDLFVAPSLYESFGLIYLEAMNYGKPVIGCRAGGIPEVIDEGVTGLLVEPEAPDELAQTLIHLLQAPQKLHDLGLAGRQRLLERFTHLQMARRFANIYRKVVTIQAA
jgi:hypothetical protein